MGRSAFVDCVLFSIIEMLFSAVLLFCFLFFWGAFLFLFLFWGSSLHGEEFYEGEPSKQNYLHLGAVIELVGAATKSCNIPFKAARCRGFLPELATRNAGLFSIAFLFLKHKNNDTTWYLYSPGCWDCLELKPSL